MEDVFLEDVLEPITILLTMVLRIGSFYRQGRVDRSSNIGSEVNPDSDWLSRLSQLMDNINPRLPAASQTRYSTVRINNIAFSSSRAHILVGGEQLLRLIHFTNNIVGAEAHRAKATALVTYPIVRFQETIIQQKKYPAL